MLHGHGMQQSPQKSAFSGSGNVGLGGLLYYAVDGEESAADHIVTWALSGAATCLAFEGVKTLLDLSEVTLISSPARE